MLFNSFAFVLFMLAVYALYGLLHRHYRWQNGMLLVASYFFYGYWDWRFCSLLLISTLVDFHVARRLARTQVPKSRKALVTISICVNLGILGFFKYFNFFADSTVELLGLVGLHADPVTLQIILPVGISFYTFQTLSYTIDVYRGRMEPTNNLLDFGLFVAFFPQLVAGPIERAVSLLPQISKPRKIGLDQVHAGLFLILWGFYKKTVVADNLAVIANQVFNNYEDCTGLGLVVGILAFTGQIYGDFSGYSDIARGVAKLLGFDLMVNFRLPYFATSPSTFWQRWHVSLSSWLRDYLYIPLGGNRGSSWKTYRNLMLTMLLGGLWHGAAWTFVIWGAYHGVLLISYRAFEARGSARASPPPGPSMGARLRLLAAMALMFVFTVIGWVIFRSESIEQIWGMLSGIGPGYDRDALVWGYDLLFYSLPLIAVQLYQNKTADLLAMTKLRPVLRALFYTFLALSLFLFGVRESQEFIYFQF